MRYWGPLGAREHVTLELPPEPAEHEPPETEAMRQRREQYRNTVAYGGPLNVRTARLPFPAAALGFRHTPPRQASAPACLPFSPFPPR